MTNGDTTGSALVPHTRCIGHKVLVVTPGITVRPAYAQSVSGGESAEPRNCLGGHRDPKRMPKSRVRFHAVHGSLPYQ
ncbi:hypothetical protein WBG83_17660 [Paenibacillus sp. y28]